MVKELVEEKTLSKDKESEIKKIVVYNDDVNSFDWVVSSFIEVLEHDVIQAEQCSLIIHCNGKCGVKSGSYDELEPVCLELLRRQISAKIE